jgi:uncharacterized protein
MATAVEEIVKVKSALTWFEIPCGDLDRAQQFYETVLETSLKRGDAGDVMCVFPASREGVAGALVKRPFMKPSPDGALVYLNCGGMLDEALRRVGPAGGLILMPKTPVPGGFGHFACVRDSEGNHVGLHQH